MYSCVCITYADFNAVVATPLYMLALITNTCLGYFVCRTAELYENKQITD